MRVHPNLRSMGSGRTLANLASPKARQRSGGHARHRASNGNGGPLRLAPTSGRVLVVDDHVDARVVMEEFLEGQGYHVSVVKSGFEALAILEAGIPFDVIILDLLMPEGDGYEFLQAARGLPAPAQQIPIAVVSGVADPKVVGAHVVMQKPINLDDLLEVVQALIPKH